MQVIVFALSKRQCEELAGHLKSVQLNSRDEGALVESIFWGAMDILSPDDRRLPQICCALPMLQRGIGVHHSGLLPIVKEVIEVLFGEGLIKVRPCACSQHARTNTLQTQFGVIRTSSGHASGVFMVRHATLALEVVVTLDMCACAGALCDRDLLHGLEHARAHRGVRWRAQV